MKVKLHGVRGSLPAPHSPETIKARLRKTLADFVAAGKSGAGGIDAFLESRPTQDLGGFGGNTVCVEIAEGAESLIIDAGSGIRRLGEALMAGPCRNGQGEIDILFTHFHWDHLIGLPFFVPIFVPGIKVRMHAVQPDFEANIRQLFKRPLFPVAFEDLRSTISFHRLEERKPTLIKGFQVTPYKLDHPDPCWGFRVERSGKTYSHCVDTEGTRVSRTDLGPDLPLYQNVDLMFFDAQYTLLEAVEKMNWGHSAAPIGLNIALRENVKQIIFAHHDPGASDEKIADAEEQTREYLEVFRDNAKTAGRTVPELKWQFAREGDVIDV
jgi:phosphoribosyl 1,2-cyclic phosphodiesterase